MQDDASLVVAARAGDGEAFAAIYDRYSDRLHDFCHSVLRDRDEAADAMQDTFVLASQRLGQLRDPTRLRSWLFAIARHESIRRGKARRRMAPTEDVGVDVASADVGPEDRVSRDDLGEVVWAAAAGLSERDRALLDLHLRQGLDGQELGNAIGVSASHAYVLMNRMRAQVERSLGALLVARQGSDDCAELRVVLEGWDGRFSPLWRKRVARHVEGCALCEEKRAALTSPLALLAAAPLVPAPMLLRETTLHRVQLASATHSAPTANGHAQPRGWHRASARDGFPPSTFAQTQHWRIAAVAAAAVVAIVGGVAIADTFGRGGGDGSRPIAAGVHRRAPASTAAPTLTSTGAVAISPPESTPATPTPTTTQHTTATSAASTPGPAGGGDTGGGPVPPTTPADTQGPTISDQSASPVCVVADGSSTAVVSATVTDPSGVSSVSVTATHDSGEPTEVRAMTGSGTYKATIGGWYKPGTVTVTVTAIDGVGNTTTVSANSVDVVSSLC